MLKYFWNHLSYVYGFPFVKKERKEDLLSTYICYISKHNLLNKKQ